MLPPSRDKCQICAVAHDPDQPHNPQSFFYKWHFATQWKRTPTWADAMAHCPEKVRLEWTEMLTGAGIDINASDVTGGIQSQEELDTRLDNA